MIIFYFSLLLFTVLGYCFIKPFSKYIIPSLFEISDYFKYNVSFEVELRFNRIKDKL